MAAFLSEWWSRYEWALIGNHVTLTALGVLALWLPIGPATRLRMAWVLAGVLLLAPVLLSWAPHLSLGGRDVEAMSIEVGVGGQYVGEGETTVLAGSEAVFAPASDSIWAWLRWLWAAGAMVGLLWLVRDLVKLDVHLRRLPRLAEAPLTLVDSTATSPYSVRLLKPKLILPANPVDSLNAAMLRHEEAHLRHLDTWQVLLWRLVRAFFWWNPLVHFLAARVTELQEWRADEEASAGDSFKALELGRGLLQMAIGQQGHRLVQSARARSTRALRRRVLRLQSLRPHTRSGHLSLLVLMLTLLAGLVAWAQTVPKAESDPAPSKEAVWAAELGPQELAEETEDLVAVEVKFVEYPMDGPVENGIEFLTGEKQAAPATAVLSEREVREWLNKHLALRESTSVSYPRVMTANGREVVIKSVINEPIRRVTDPETKEEKIESIPIGTIINITPLILKSDMIFFDTNVTLSKIIGEREIDGVTYPVVSSRVFSAPLRVNQGDTIHVMSMEADGDKALSMFLSATRIPLEEFQEAEQAPTNQDK